MADFIFSKKKVILKKKSLIDMNLEETARKIRTMEIRGAGRIARAAANALYIHSMEEKTTDLVHYRQRMNEAADLLVSTRPTAVSLPNAVNLVMRPLKN